MPKRGYQYQPSDEEEVEEPEPGEVIYQKKKKASQKPIQEEEEDDVIIDVEGATAATSKAEIVKSSKGQQSQRFVCLFRYSLVL